jgi:hypothetical protein
MIVVHDNYVTLHTRLGDCTLPPTMKKQVLGGVSFPPRPASVCFQFPRRSWSGPRQPVGGRGPQGQGRDLRDNLAPRKLKRPKTTVEMNESEIAGLVAGGYLPEETRGDPRQSRPPSKS